MFSGFIHLRRRRFGSAQNRASHAERRAEVGHVAELEGGVAGVVSDGAEHLRVPHPEHDRAIAAGGFAEDAPALDAVAPGDEGQHLGEEVVLVGAGRGGVDVLVAADAGEAVGGDDDHLGAGAREDQPIEAAPEVFPERVGAEEHPAGAGEAGEGEQRRRGLRRRVAGGKVDVELALGGIAERVVAKPLAVEAMHDDAPLRRMGHALLCITARSGPSLPPPRAPRARLRWPKRLKSLDVLWRGPTPGTIECRGARAERSAPRGPSP
jgi:hypothetical protein